MYKLFYFDTKGRGEVIRLLFVLAGVTFEDVRIQRSEWPAIKSGAQCSRVHVLNQSTFLLGMPWGQIPVLQVNGQQLAQTIPILSYLSRKFGITLPAEPKPQDFENVAQKIGS